MATVLFVGVHHAGRSLMSAGLCERQADGRHKALSAGTTPGEHVHPEVVEVMRELGIECERIPLIVAGPRVPTRAVPDQVRIVDVMPTILELVGVAAPSAVQGVSLLPLGRGERLDLLGYSETWYPRYHYGWSELTAVRDGRSRY